MVKLISDHVQNELREFARPGPRMADEIACVISVMLAIVFAQLGDAHMVSWAAISALVLLKSDTMETILRGAMRMVGTLLGGALSLVVAPLAVDSLPLAVISAGLVGAVGLYGMLTGRRAYAWFLFGLTFEIVLLDQLSNPHLATFELARTRVIEVGAGTLACVLVSLGAALISGNDWLANRKPRPERMCWNPTAARHAAQTGLALAVLPALYHFVRIPELTQAAITIMAVMIVPVAGLGRSGLVPVSQRLLHRAIGCVAGGLLAVAVLLLAHGNVAVIIAGTCFGLFVGRHLETGPKATQYVGLQFSMALLTALVPDSYSHIAPSLGLERLVGIGVGMVLLEPVLLAWHFIAKHFASKPAESQGDASSKTAAAA